MVGWPSGLMLVAMSPHVNVRKHVMTPGPVKQRDDPSRYHALIEKLGIRDAINLLPPRVFLPAKAAEAAVQRDRQRAQLVEKGKRQAEVAAALKETFRGKREVRGHSSRV